MGHNNTKNNINSVSVDSCELQRIFANYKKQNTREKEQLLAYIPISCNYAVVNGWTDWYFGRTVEGHTIEYHMSINIRPNSNCQIRVSKEWYLRLNEFCKNNITDKQMETINNELLKKLYKKENEDILNNLLNQQL
jgi:hypothetical protein